MDATQARHSFGSTYSSQPVNSSDGKKKKILISDLCETAMTCLNSKQASDISIEQAQTIISTYRTAAQNASFRQEHPALVQSILRSVTKLSFVMPATKIWPNSNQTLLENIKFQLITKNREYAKNLSPHMPQDLVFQTDNGERVPASALLLRLASESWTNLLNSGLVEGTNFYKNYPSDKDADPVVIKIAGVSKNTLEAYVASTNPTTPLMLNGEEDLQELMELYSFIHRTHGGEKLGDAGYKIKNALENKHLNGETAVALFDFAAFYSIPRLKKAALSFIIEASKAPENLVETVNAITEASAQLTPGIADELITDLLLKVKPNTIPTAEQAQALYKAAYAQAQKQDTSQLDQQQQHNALMQMAESLAPFFVAGVGTEDLFKGIEGTTPEALSFMDPQHARNACAGELLKTSVEGWFARINDQGPGWDLVQGSAVLKQKKFGSRSSAAKEAVAHINRFMAQVKNLSSVHEVGLDRFPEKALDWFLTQLQIGTPVTYLNLQGTKLLSTARLQPFADSLIAVDLRRCQGMSIDSQHLPKTDIYADSLGS